MKSDNHTHITVYLDYAATTPTDPEVVEKMLPYFDATYGNPSSMHASGRRAGQAIAEARRDVADILNAQADEIIFTGSGTESDNLALLGTARANRAHGNHVIVSSIEHKAVLESARQLEKEGFCVSIVPVDTFGCVDVNTCLNLITKDTILMSVMYANNEIGTIQPIKELAIALKTYRDTHACDFPLLHTDACQAVGFLSLDVRDLGVDLMTLNGSKIYGPKGIGMLYKKKGVKIEPIIFGGEQEKNMRAGTESVPLIVGFAHALKKVDAARETESRRLTTLRDYFIGELQEKIPVAILNGHPHNRLPNNIHISIPRVEGESISLMLDRLGVEVSTGSACSAYDLKPSHVLLALGQHPDIVHGSIRFSLGKYTTRKELEYVLSVFPEIIERLTNMSAITAHI